MSGTSHVKNLGQVAAIVFTDIAPTIKTILWYDLTTEVIKYYNKYTNSWLPLVDSLGDARNIETEGTGLVFKEIQNTILYFRRLKGGDGVLVKTEGNNVVISLDSYLRGTPNLLEFDSSVGDSISFFVSSNTSWQLIIPPELINPSTGWLQFERDSGYGYSEIVIEVTKLNPGTTSRTGIFILKDSTGVLPDREIVVSQVGSASFVAKYIQSLNDFTCEFLS